MPHKERRKKTLGNLCTKGNIYCYTLISTSEFMWENEKELSEGNHKKGVTENDKNLCRWDFGFNWMHWRECREEIFYSNLKRR